MYSIRNVFILKEDMGSVAARSRALYEKFKSVIRRGAENIDWFMSQIDKTRSDWPWMPGGLIDKSLNGFRVYLVKDVEFVGDGPPGLIYLKGRGLYDGYGDDSPDVEDVDGNIPHEERENSIVILWADAVSDKVKSELNSIEYGTEQTSREFWSILLNALKDADLRVSWNHEIGHLHQLEKMPTNHAVRQWKKELAGMGDKYGIEETARALDVIGAFSYPAKEFRAKFPTAQHLLRAVKRGSKFRSVDVSEKRFMKYIASAWEHLSKEN